MENANLHVFDKKSKILPQIAVVGHNIEMFRGVEQLALSFNDTLHVAVGYFWFDIFHRLLITKGIPL